MKKKLVLFILLGCTSLASASFVPGPIQVNTSGGTSTSVGYATGGSSVPVSVLNTVPVTGTFFQASQPVTVTQPTVFGATTTYNGTQIVGVVQPTVLGATVTFNGAQPITLTQPTVIGATVTYNGTQVVGIVQPTVIGATVTYNGTQIVGIVQSGVIGATVTFNGTQNIQGTLSDNNAAATSNRLGTISGIYENTYNGGTAGVVGRDATISVGTDGMQRVAVLPAIAEKSYSASTNTVTAASTASDITALCGNASNMVLVYGLRVSCTETTAGNVNLTIVKRSSKYVGNFSTMSAVAQDSTYAVTNSTAIFFAANPTLGTLVGHLDNYKLGCMAPATATANDIYISPASWRVKPIVLRGASECIGVNLESQTVTGGLFTVGYEWIETTTITP